MTKKIPATTAFTIVCLTEHVAECQNEEHLAPLSDLTSWQSRIVIINAGIIIDKIWRMLGTWRLPVEYVESFDFDFVPLAASYLDWHQLAQAADADITDNTSKKMIASLGREIIAASQDAFISIREPAAVN